jgi:hypothetical protein
MHLIWLDPYLFPCTSRNRLKKKHSIPDRDEGLYRHNAKQAHWHTGTQALDWPGGASDHTPAGGEIKNRGASR